MQGKGAVNTQEVNVMATSNHERNTTGLAEHRENKKQSCNQRVDDAIKQLIKDRQGINFNSVSELAGVSKKYLYDNHFQRIDALRRQQEGLPSPKQVKREMTDASKDVLIAAKNKKISELEAEVTRLKSILQRKYGEEYDSALSKK